MLFAFDGWAMTVDKKELVCRAAFVVEISHIT